MKYELDWDKYNWREFEKICYEYIKNVYSAPFYKVTLTKERKDSGRDIIITDQTGTYEAWGECKHHKRNIDLSVIGKNLVLALSHQINKAIFFSVTSITPNTKIEILNIAQKNGFEVLFLDGNSLNTEILNCQKVSKKYFRKEYETYIRKKNNNNIWVDSLISEFPFAEDARNNAKKQYHLENSFKIFLHIFIKNVGMEDISEIKVTLLNTSETDIIFYGSKQKQKKDLTTYSDLLFTFSGMVFSPKKNIETPQIVIDYTLSTGSFHQEKISAGTVDASDIWKAPYVNTNSAVFFAKVTDVLEKVVPQNYVKVFYLYGKSGMGKSRLMSEIENKSYENAYRVIHVDFREQEEISAMRSLVMALLGISFSKSKLYLEYSEFEKIYFNKLEAHDITLLYDFIYSSSTTLHDGLKNTIINLLVEESNREKILLSFDNIQEISRELQIVFWTVLEECRTISIPVCFIFSQNTERKADHQNVLVNYLNSCGENYENFLLSQYCDILTENDAIILMQDLLHLSSESHNFIKKILSKIELCPMDILLLAKSLEQIPGLFQTIGDCKYITNTNAFSLDNYEIPEAFNIVVELRISNLLNNVDKPEDYKQLFSLLSFFEGTLKMEIFEKCGFSMDMLSLANKNIILKVNPIKNTIHFYHEKVYQYIKKQYVGLSTSLLDTIYTFYNQIENITVSDSYFYLKLLIAQERTELAIEWGLKLLEQYKNSIYGNYTIKICSLLQQIIDSIKKPEEYFTVIFTKADLLLERINISEAEKLFEEAKEIIIKKSFFFKPQVIIHFFHRYINQKLHTLQYEEAFAAIKELYKKAEVTTNASMIINDRLCVVLYSLGKETKALEAIEKVIKTAQKENNTIWLSIAYSDKAFCHYYNSKNIAKICSNFSNAIYYYENGPEYDDISRKIEIQIQKTLINIFRQDYSKAKTEIQQSIQIAEESNYGYLLIPSYNIYSYLMIVNNQMDEAQNLLTKALEYANTFSNPKALISIYNNIGSMYSTMGEYEEAYTRYLTGLRILKKICKPQNSFRYMSLLSNIVKVSILLNRSETSLEIIKAYDFEELKKYNDKCQEALNKQDSFNTFSNGVLNYDGYDYLY